MGKHTAIKKDRLAGGVLLGVLASGALAVAALGTAPAAMAKPKSPTHPGLPSITHTNDGGPGNGTTTVTGPRGGTDTFSTSTGGGINSVDSTVTGPKGNTVNDTGAFTAPDPSGGNDVAFYTSSGDSSALSGFVRVPAAPAATGTPSSPTHLGLPSITQTNDGAPGYGTTTVTGPLGGTDSLSTYGTTGFRNTVTSPDGENSNSLSVGDSPHTGGGTYLEGTDTGTDFSISGDQLVP
jgi:hypothetical protein